MELIDVLNNEAKKTGETLNIRQIHERKKYHKSVHIWIINNKKILLQKRSNKIHDEKNKWDISSSGHVNSGEESLAAACREIKEELGLDIDQKNLIEIFKTKIEEPKNYEFRDVYKLEHDVDISKCNVPNHEVSELKWISIEEYFNELKNKNKNYVLKDVEYIKLLYRALKN